MCSSQRNTPLFLKKSDFELSKFVLLLFLEEIRMRKEISLSHSDHLQLLFDYKIKRDGGTANTSQLLIELSSSISADELKSYLLSNAYFKQLVNTTVVRPFFKKERYHFGENEELLFSEITAENIVYSTVFKDDDLGAKPLKVTLLHLKDSCALLIQVNHVYIDNNGVKNLLRSFHNEKFDFHRTIKPDANSYFKRLKHGFEFTKIMLKKWREPISNISSSKKLPVQKDYLMHGFSSEETEFIKSKVVRSYHIQSMSSLLMATYCTVIKDFILQKNGKLGKFSFQQPFDLTAKKEPKYILGNRFSFLHYRLKADQVTNIEEIQDELNKQTMQQMKANVAPKSLELQSILRFLPLPIHYWMINLPARGKMSTFAHTFIGESKIIDEFAGRKIKNIINIPPVMKNPPITFGSLFYDGKLRVKICFDTNSITREEAVTLLSSLKQRLLQPKNQ